MNEDDSLGWVFVLLALVVIGLIIVSSIAGHYKGIVDDAREQGYTFERVEERPEYWRVIEATP